MILVLLIHVAATLFMTGVIWLVQLLVYPQFANVDASSFAKYHAAHNRRITLVVAPAMVVELVTAVALVARPPAEVSTWMLWVGLALVAVVWCSTAFVQVPLHGKLGRGYNEATIGQLNRSNWIRTIAWSIRSVLVLVLVGAAT